MKKLISSILFLFCVSAMMAQTSTVDYYQPSKQKLLSKDRVSASISMGAGVSFLNSSRNAAYTTFIAPQIAYQLNSKFKLNIGLMHYSLTGNSVMMNNNETNKSVSGNLLFVGGQYQLNKRLIMSGAVMTDVNNFNRNLKAASLGLDYKVSEHSTIGIRATVLQGNSDYYMNP
ncbi:MAG: hypothetical protein H0W84_09460, partial [Bacteroidetes bacterium]|nr:hypothetical protein [Bacteroidota bacterium]